MIPNRVTDIYNCDLQSYTKLVSGRSGDLILIHHTLVWSAPSSELTSCSFVNNFAIFICHSTATHCPHKLTSNQLQLFGSIIHCLERHGSEPQPWKHWRCFHLRSFGSADKSAMQRFWVCQVTLTIKMCSIVFSTADVFECWTSKSRSCKAKITLAIVYMSFEQLSWITTSCPIICTWIVGFSSNKNSLNGGGAAVALVLIFKFDCNPFSEELVVVSVIIGTGNSSGLFDDPLASFWSSMIWDSVSSSFRCKSWM